MTISTTYVSLIVLAAIMSFAAPHTVRADIQEISSEEMTEAHIRDTTVIIQRQSTEDTKAPINVKVTPNKGDELDSIKYPNQDAQQRPDLTPLTDSYLSEQRERSLQQQQSSVKMQPYDSSQIEREHNLNRIWKQFDLKGDIPTDYGNLTFPTYVDIPAGTDLSIGSHEFSISIPNTNNYKPSSQQTPNGEYQINITDDNIKFIINLPKNN